MTINDSHINCPNCGHNVDVNAILYRQLDAELKRKYQQQLAVEQARIKSEQQKIETLRIDIQNKEKNIARQIDAGIETRITAERIAIAKEERAKAESVTKGSLEQLQRELAENAEQLKDLNETKMAMLRLQREKDSLKATLEAENEAKLNKLLAEERLTIQKTEANRNELKIREKEHLIETLNKQLTEAQQRAEQGSMQSQGEAQELAVEEWLKGNFAHDDIEEIKKGALGGDCVQTINTTSKLGCGTIYYESKRTKTFQPGWIEKFKADIGQRNTDIGVLVSQARPHGMERMGMVQGIWVCNFEEFKGLSLVLRNHLIQLDQARISHENRGDKMAMLYEFLQSTEFRLQVEAIVDGFTQMKIDLDKEKRSMQGHWKKREKQIEKVLLNTGNMYQSVRGIAGSSIQPVQALEFDTADV